MLKIGQIWERDNRQFIIFEVGDEANHIKMKDADAAVWSNAVVYQPCDAMDEWYIRTNEDFLNKYQFVSDPAVEIPEEVSSDDSSEG